MTVSCVIWGSVVMSVCMALGLFLLMSLGLTHPASVPSPGMSLIGGGDTL